MRCALHDLATGPDGRCVVCRRASERGLSAVTGWLVLGGIGAVLTASVAYGAVRAWSARDAADVERPRPGAAAPPNDSEPGRAARGRARAPIGSTTEPAVGAATGDDTEAASDAVNVVVYTTSWCPVCRRAKKWMYARGIVFEERDVEASAENARRMRALNPRGGVPTFDVDGQVLVGFGEQDLSGAIRAAADRRARRAP